MTSKNLFFKLIKQDFQKRIWCPILIFIGYFLALEVRLLMMFDSLEEKLAKKDYSGPTLKEYAELRFFGTNIWVLAVLACGVALLCAISGFAYLHSRKQLDTYHSLPVNRAQLFFAKYISGVMQFFFPFILHIFACLGIVAGKGAFSSGVFANAMRSIGVSLLVFLLAYAVFIMAVELSGNLIVSILGSGVLFMYSALVSLTAYGLFHRFFHTYAPIGIADDLNFLKCFGFSPMSLLIKFFTQNNDALDTYDEYFKYNADYIWVIVVAVLVYTLLAFLLHWKRASESAGKAIAFQWAEPVIKTLIVIPTAFFAGDFFSELVSGKNDNTWYLFGVIFGYIIMALLMEIIFRFDIKSAFCHKKQLLFNTVCVMMIFVIFRYDVLGYDTYVPADKELTSCAVSINGLMASAPMRRIGNHYIIYMGTDEYRMEHVAIQGNPSVMEFARKVVDDGYRKGKIWEDTSSDSEKDYKSITYGYNLKNGKSVYREYMFDASDAQNRKLLADIFNDESYKTGTNPMLSNGWEQEYKSLNCTGNMCSETLEMTPKFQSQLLETYREEFLELDFETALSTCPVGYMTTLTVEEHNFIMENSENRNNFIFSEKYNGSLIYPQFTKTIALLKENGFDIYETYSPEEIDHINVTYKKRIEVYGDGTPYSTTRYTEIANTFETEQKQEILDSILNSSLNWQLSAYSEFYDDNFEVTLYMTDQILASQRTYYFKKDMVPQFIYDSEEYKEALAQ